MFHKRVDIRILERILQGFIMIFSIAAIAVFIRSILLPEPGYMYSMIVIIIILLLLLITSLFVLLYIAVKIWEQHIIPDDTYKTDKKSESTPKKIRKK